MTYTLETSQSTAALDDAIGKAQAQIKNAAKDSVNPHFRSKYADLGAVFDACREALTKASIAITQWPVASDDGTQHLITRLAHKGEWIQCRCAVPMDKPTAHGMGSAITYARRYALSAALGIVADEDDDGNAAIGKPSNKPPVPMDTPKATAQQFSEEADVIEGTARWIEQQKTLLANYLTLEDVSNWVKREDKSLKKLYRDNPEAWHMLKERKDEAQDRIRAPV